MTTYYLPEVELSGLAGQACQAATFVPTSSAHLAWMDSVHGDSPLAALAGPRPSQSPKGFFLPAAESMGRYGVNAGAETVEAVRTQPLILLGVRACELRARDYLDKVLTDGEFADPLYRSRRESTMIVSCDCVDCAESCCCTLVGGLPYPTEGYDVNLTPIDGGYIVDVASERGAQWLGAERPAGLTDVSPAQEARRDELRRAMVERLERQNARFDWAASDQSAPALPNDDDVGWQAFAADCVECGACTNVCPTCHCFYLYDQVLGADQFERVRTWDSCLLSSYHRMAAGAGTKLTPRPRLSSRLANRVLHKFTYSPQQYGMLGCVGCGRCIDACLGAIDIRQVVKELAQ